MALQRSTSAEESADWVQQSGFEVGDLRESLLCDMGVVGKPGRFPVSLNPLEQGIQGLYDAMRRGGKGFRRKDLPFPGVAETRGDRVSCRVRVPLRQINEIHRFGLDTGEED